LFEEEVELPNGEIRMFEFVERSPGVRALMFQSHHLLINREWRSEFNSWDWRLPGGRVFESIEEYDTARKSSSDLSDLNRRAVSREVREETGVVTDPSEWSFFATSVAGATIRWDLHYFSTHTDRIPLTYHWKAPETAEEQTETFWKSFDEIHRIIESGEMREDRSVVQTLKFLASSASQTL